MKGRTVVFIITVGVLLSIVILSRLIADYEVYAKSGFSQVVFLVGFVLGLIVEFILIRIDSRLSEMK